MAEASFGVLYDGPALDSGEIAVADLAPALLALGGLFTETSVVLYPSRPPVALNIKATGDGSFWIYLHLVAEEWDDLMDIWSGETATALATMSATVYSLFSFIKWTRSRKVVPAPDPVAPPEPGVVRISAPDGTTMDIPSEVWLLYQRQSARRKARDVVAPLDRDGIDRLEIRPSREAPPEIVVHEADLAWFDVPLEESPEALTDSTRETVVEIVSLSYEDNKRWRLREGAASFNAPILDDHFWQRVHRREIAFAEGDKLKVVLRVVQSLRADGKLTADHTVVQVLDFLAPAGGAS